MRWYVGLFLFACLLFIGSHYKWFGLFKTDLDKSNDKFKEFRDFIPILDKMSQEERNKDKSGEIKYDEYENSIKKLSKSDIILHAKYMSNFIIEDYTNLIKLFNTAKNLERTDPQTANKMYLDAKLHEKYIRKLEKLHRNIFRKIIQDNPDLEKDLSDIAKPVEELKKSTMKALS